MSHLNTSGNSSSFNASTDGSPVGAAGTHGGDHRAIAGAGMLHLTFWQHPFVQNILPLLASLLLHLGLILLGVLSYQVVTRMTQKSKEQVNIPQLTFAPDAQFGGIPHPGTGGDPTRDAAQDQFPDVPADSQGIADQPSRDLAQALAGGGSGNAANDGTIAAGPMSGGFGRGIHGLSAGIGEGSGDGSGGVLAPFSVPGGGSGVGPKVSFGQIPLGSNVRRVVFVCDATGSMMAKFDLLRVQLHHTIDQLRPPQSFNVIFFQESARPPLDPGQLLFASPENKRKIFDYIDTYTAKGPTDPQPALKAAFVMHPQLIYFLCDPSDFPDTAGTIELIRSSNPDRKIVINTLAFIEHDEQGEQMLKTIARENGGTFRYVSDEDLSR